MFPTSTILDLMLAAGIFGILTGCLHLWFRIGARARAARGQTSEHLGTLQSAILGLLALLLGFSFALAAGRFSSRSQLIVDEANAIGSAWGYCDLLPEAQRPELQRLLQEYTAQRIALYEAGDEAGRREVLAQSELLNRRIWGLVTSAVRSNPSLANVILRPFDELGSVHGARAAAGRRHLPGMLLLLLLSCSVAAMSAVGYGCGLAGNRNLILTLALTFIVSGTLWAIIDMDHPRRGLIRVGQEPMLQLQRSLVTPPAAKP